jgi:hypothetical protein
MANITPKSEGNVTEAQADAVRNSLLAMIEPALDGDVSMQDAIQAGTSALTQLVPAIRALPDGETVKTVGVSLGSIGSEILTDLQVIYPDEEVAQ